MDYSLKLAADLPSSHEGGVLPGNQMGLSGSATAETVVLDLVLTGAANLLNLRLPPLRKQAFVVDPLFWEQLEVDDELII